MIKFEKQKNKGFSLVEVIVAIFIFSISIGVMMSVFSRGIQSTAYAKNKMIAIYLAEEGVEYIRNLRDNYIYQENPDWTAFMAKLKGASCDQAYGCYFDNTSLVTMQSLPMLACPSQCPPLSFANGKYNYSAAPSSGFRRKIFIESKTSAIKVTSTVFYNEGNNTGSVSLSEILFNTTQ